MEIFTIGHWNCPRGVFIGELDKYDINTVIDIRSLPGSKRSPQYNKELMLDWLEESGIAYFHLIELGGRRRNQDADPSVNAGWLNKSFHSYADYTLTDTYKFGIEYLEKLASDTRVAYMCGEPMPWRCHRSIVSNTLASRGWTVNHIMHGAKLKTHELGMWGASPVVQQDGTILYPASDVLQGMRGQD